ncbi:hypothetical protein [Rhodococcus sp. As11]|uniref:hypothetical protein n=1 Tax=Rhodococcus sp. As11 TaxID=3029189 RepID=UPI003B7C8BCC
MTTPDQPDTPEQVWARHYLRHQLPAERTAAAKAEREAQTAFETILAEQPWIAALLNVATARRQKRLTAEREDQARTILGLPVHNRTEPLVSIGHWDNGQLSADFLARPIAQVVDKQAAQHEQQQRTEREQQITALIADDTRIAELRVINERDERAAEQDPVEQVRAGGGRVDVDTIDIDGQPHTRYFNLDTRAEVIIRPDGNVYRRPPRTHAVDQPADWTT